MFYFGTDHEDALLRYRQQSAELHAGRTPQVIVTGMSLRDVVNRYLTLRLMDVRARKLSPRTWQNYDDAAKLLITTLGATVEASTLGPADFAKISAVIADRAPVSRARLITTIRTILKTTADDGVIPLPRFGSSFRARVAKEIRLAKAATGPKLYSAAQIRRLIEMARPQMRAMIYLGINCAFGPTDCALLTRQALNLGEGVHRFPRPKTGAARMAALWPETIKAVKAAAKLRVAPLDAGDDDLLFLTQHGRRWVRATERNFLDMIAQAWAKLRTRYNRGLKKTDPMYIAGSGFYTLRRTFRTVADEIPNRDQHAIHLIMGHLLPGMSDVYVQQISVDRVRAVTNHVRAWLLNGS
jgi:integrase